MGSKLSKLSLESFEFFNEIVVAIGAGIAGLGVLLINGIQSDINFLTIAVVSVAFVALIWSFQCPDQTAASENKIVFITGCDSGLGYSLAQHACDMGYKVVAGCLNLDSAGAKDLEEKYGEKIKKVQVDITKSDAINQAIDAILAIIEEDPDNNVLWAVVNNAGIMTFAEFEWQTEELIQNQITTNLIGTCLVSKAFCPLLRKYEARLINITSHCSKTPLPGLSIYGGTKAAIRSWSDALRQELGKYGVKVVNFIPGSFATQTFIMANHVEQGYEMQKNFTPEQKLFYSDYFSRYNAYLNCLTLPETVEKIDDRKLYKTFETILMDNSPKFEYINEPFKDWFIHKVFAYSPRFIRDKAINYSMGMPQHQLGKCEATTIAI